MSSTSLDFPPPHYSYKDLTSSDLNDHSEPEIRSQNVIFRTEGGSKWHVKVTFKGVLTSQIPSSPTGAAMQFSADNVVRRPKRREEFAELVSSIDFRRLDLIDDTVTEITLTMPSTEEEEPNGWNHDACPRPLPGNFSTLPKSNRFAEIAKLLVYSAREDPGRVRYPPLDDVPLPTVPFASLRKEKEWGRVFRVRADYPDPETEQVFIFKEIERPFYRPVDTEVDMQEIHNLRLFDGVPTIVQLAALVTSEDPYLTTPGKERTPVIRGMLLEYAKKGNLEAILHSQQKSSLFPTWRRWPAQIADALIRLHAHGLAHGDVKLSNIVITTEGDAQLIDLACNGNFTLNCLAPDFVEELIERFDDIGRIPWEVRKGNDVWGFGKILMELSRWGWEEGRAEALSILAWDTMNGRAHERLGLTEVVERLEVWRTTEVEAEIEDR